MYLAPLVLLVAISSVAIRKPTPEPNDQCTKWRGTVSGNDPSVAVNAMICRDKTKVRGTLVWESSRSGSSTRTLEGTWQGNTVTLRDIALTGRPNPGWIFCKVDRYSLTASGDKLEGSYHSEACGDTASVSLERVR